MHSHRHCRRHYHHHRHHHFASMSRRHQLWLSMTCGSAELEERTMSTLCPPHPAPGVIIVILVESLCGNIKIKVCTMSTFCVWSSLSYFNGIFVWQGQNIHNVHIQSTTRQWCTFFKPFFTQRTWHVGQFCLFCCEFWHFMWTFTGLINAMVSQSWQISGMRPRVVIIVIS